MSSEPRILPVGANLEEPVHSGPDEGEWTVALKRLEHTARLLSLDNDLHDMLAQPRRSVEVAVPIMCDDGSRETFVGYRVQHSLTRGPAKGGVRYDADCSLEQMKALAMNMTWKCALLGLPYGGGKGGVRCDPTTLSLTERERIARRYTSELAPMIGENVDVLAPDLNTSEREMAWVMDTYASVSAGRARNSVTGKPVSIGGNPMRRDATGAGVAAAVRWCADHDALPQTPIRVSIAGVGDVGLAVAEHLYRDPRFLLVGLSDVSGAVYESDGIDSETFLNRLRHGLTVGEVGGSVAIERDELMAAPSDVLVPAAVSNMIDVTNVDRVQAKVVVEAANAAISAVAEEHLLDQGVLVVPDLLANGGGVVASHLENLPETAGPNDATNLVVPKAISTALERATELATERGISLREAAMMIGVKEVAEAHIVRGLYP